MLKELRRLLKNEKKNKDIFDILVYGSFTKGKYDPRDIDIAVIFREAKLKERLEKIQLIKRKIKSKKIDIKAYLLEDLFKKEVFSRSGLFLEGVSVFDGRSFSRKIGFKGFVLYVYNLRGKTHTDKVKFNYVLSGRNGKGIVEMLEGKHLSPGTILMPVKNSFEFEDVLKLHKISFKKKNMLVQI